MTMSENPTTVQLLTIPEAAEQMRVPASWLYSATRTGVFPCVRFGKYVRIRTTDVEEWIEGGGRGGSLDDDGQ
jgi:excisionase family DNA binding protein